MPPGLSTAFLVKATSGTRCPVQGLEGGRLLAPASAHGLCIPQQGFRNPAPPREDVARPALRGPASWDPG